MTKAEKLAWGLGLIVCLAIPAVLGYWQLALAGVGALGVLAWQIAPWRSGQETHHRPEP